MTLITAMKTVLDNIIANEEGGWVLTPETANDPSGGWTYAGVTATTWNKRNSIPASYRTTDFKTMQNYIKQFPTIIKEYIYQIYEYDYIIASNVEELPSYLWHVYLSAFINSEIGAVTALQKFLNSIGYSLIIEVDGELGPITKDAMYVFSKDSSIQSGQELEEKAQFCFYWLTYYAKLVTEQPTMFLPDLLGWISRVQKAFNAND